MWAAKERGQQAEQDSENFTLLGKGASVERVGSCESSDAVSSVGYLPEYRVAFGHFVAATRRDRRAVIGLAFRNRWSDCSTSFPFSLSVNVDWGEAICCSNH